MLGIGIGWKTELGNSTPKLVIETAQCRADCRPKVQA
jgi:hypothetical protein